MNCEVTPFGSDCDKPAVGMIHIPARGVLVGDYATPACQYHLYAAEEFGWSPVSLDVVRSTYRKEVIEELNQLLDMKPVEERRARKILHWWESLWQR